MGDVGTAYSTASSSTEAGRELADGLGAGPYRAIVFFAFVTHDGAAIASELERRFPDARVIGCSGNGQFGNQGHGKEGACAIAIGPSKVRRVASALAPLTDDVEVGIREAAASLSAQLGQDVRELDPTTHKGLALLEGASRREEKINEALGNVAPYLEFVGGSAGDDLAFANTWVVAEGRLEHRASALMMLELAAPFRVLKTCNYVPTDTVLRVTASDPDRRLIFELDGQPAVQRYAELVGVAPDALGFPEFLANPFGVMIDDEPWLRSVVRTEGDALFFACSVIPGMELSLMRGQDLVADAERALAKTVEELGGPPSAAILFNCAYRMLEASITGATERYHEALSSAVPHAGLHSNGESYLVHLNQTLTGLVIG